jgi:DNA-binding NtrC family response regulator
VNVGAIPDELFESELFGAEAGAYTGAQSRRIGHFESAHRGTLFLDEVDALSLAGQVKLLRVLQGGEFQRLGSSKTHKVDVRVVSATNASLEQALAEGRFREDLFYRLNVVELQVPSLRDRPEDVLLLARHFLEELAGELEPGKLSPEAEAALVRHGWSGNVRELENRVQRATLVAGDSIRPEDLGLGDKEDISSGSIIAALSGDQEVERQQVLKVLEEGKGIIAHAAERLGISRQALYRKMERLGIEVERRPRG